MIKKTLLIASFCLSVHLQADAGEVPMDTLTNNSPLMEEDMLRPLEPTYLKDVSIGSAWSSNWFIGISGGTSAFVGSPVGCEDLFGRIKPTLAISLGKWFTPEVGGRVTYQGFQFKDSQIETHNFNFVHADFLWNVLGRFTTESGQSKWKVVPYVGVGLIHHESNGHKPFAFSYGIMGQINLSRRFALNMELGGATTFKDFDGVGASNRFGDNLLSLSAGITCHIGKVGYKKIVDAGPYIAQNRWLLDYTTSIRDRENKLNRQHEKDARTIAELQKILEIEGLLDMYGNRLENSSDYDSYRTYPKNDYSGLNSLRARMANKDWNGKDIPGKKEPSLSHNMPQESASSDGYNNQGECIGAPIYFFFKIDTNVLTDHSQLINLDEIARVAKKHDLCVRVTGAADSATGNEGINNALSENRANYICEQLKKRGLSKKSVTSVYVGGINQFSPIEGNRNTKVELVVHK